MTYQINIPAAKTKDVLAVLKALGVKVIPAKEKKTPNQATIKAMNELKAGRGKSFESTKALFDSIK